MIKVMEDTPSTRLPSQLRCGGDVRVTSLQSALDTLKKVRVSAATGSCSRATRQVSHRGVVAAIQFGYSVGFTGAPHHCSAISAGNYIRTLQGVGASDLSPRSRPIRFRDNISVPGHALMLRQEMPGF
ncbi:hypothetical protein Q5Y75_22460 [Ruegeria sp. 2205SS24-7]|uniref:hypothetical protein n=1 Tax=Ruegeria discodermiae TaxID=3064389 RepID=UPI002741864B|nr:hypothetical protein [Ruegeria sp. 2205SS24-7]MDP5219976.1 hypothetical protein [Ruegeria sp. 2205SS24-7]